MGKIGEIIKNNQYWLSKIPQSSLKPRRKPFKAIILTLFLTTVGLLMAFNVFAYDKWIIDFENYNLGQLHGQYDWSGYTGFQVQAGKWVYGTSASAVRTIDKPISAFELNEMTGVWELSFKGRYYHTNSDSKLYLRGNTTKYLMADVVRDGTENAQVYASFTRYDANTEVFLGTTTTVAFTYYEVPDYTWIDVKWELDFNDRWIRIFSKLSEDEDWSEFTMAGQKLWFWSTTDRTTNLIFNSIRLELASGFTMHGTDDISFTAPCSQANCTMCEIWRTCQNVGCFWYYSEWLDQGFCVSAPTGVCGEGYHYEMCQNCLTEETCEEITNCYWSLDKICKFGTGGCGEGLECQFCGSQATCEEKGCFWYEDFCWLDEKPSLFSWSDYYDEYGDYEVPSAFINNLAENTQGFFEKIGGFLITFEKSFDTQEAYQKGKDLGGAVPKARGYLASLNNFVGYLPIGDFFLFVLVFMLAIGVFKGMTKLIQLVKFW